MTLPTRYQKNVDMSYISIACKFIIIFHTKAILLTSMYTSLEWPMWDWDKFGLFCTCERGSWQEEHLNTSSYKNVPIGESFCWILLWDRITTFFNSTFLNFTLHFPSIHVIGRNIVVHEFNILLAVIFHTTSNHTLEGMQTLVPWPLADTTWPVGELTSHLKQTSILLFNVGGLLKHVFITIWKCLASMLHHAPRSTSPSYIPPPWISLSSQVARCWHPCH